MSPIFKKGSRATASNYRPISLTSVVCKLPESLICEAIVKHLTDNCALRDSQHGFVSHRSSLTNLLDYLETITRLVDQGHNIDVFYLDFSKAFDRVPHQRLLTKSKAHGINGNIYHWIFCQFFLMYFKKERVLTQHLSKLLPLFLNTHTYKKQMLIFSIKRVSYHIFD